jgi:hypothetical protein
MARAWLGRGRPKNDGPREQVISTSMGRLRVRSAACAPLRLMNDGQLHTSRTLRGRTLDQRGGWPDIDKDGRGAAEPTSAPLPPPSS